MDSAARSEARRLVVSIAGEEFFLPATAVAEVLRLRPLSRIPHAPNCLLGVASLRGTVMPVVSSRGLLGLPPADAASSARIVVLAGERPVGITVDAVTTLGVAVPGMTEVRALDIEAMLARTFPIHERRSHTAIGNGPPAQGASVTLASADRPAMLSFSIADRLYALPLRDVIEIAGRQDAVTVVDDADDAVLGVIPHRGSMLPLVSLARLLGHAHIAKGRHVIVVTVAAREIGLVVDVVRQVRHVSRDHIDEVPSVLTRGTGETRVTGIARLADGALMALLSTDMIFDDRTQARLAARSNKDLTMDGRSQDADDACQRFVVFHLGDEQYGLPIAAVDEIVRRPSHLTRLPRGPVFVEGVMNLRGKAVPVVDTRSRFGAPSRAAGGSRVIVMTIDGVQTGFSVDRVSEILGVPVSAITETPGFAGLGRGVFDRIADVEGRLVLLIEPKVLLEKAERDALEVALSAKGTVAAASR